MFPFVNVRVPPSLLSSTLTTTFPEPDMVILCPFCPSSSEITRSNRSLPKKADRAMLLAVESTYLSQSCRRSNEPVPEESSDVLVPKAEMYPELHTLYFDFIVFLLSPLLSVLQWLSSLSNSHIFFIAAKPSIISRCALA